MAAGSASPDYGCWRSARPGGSGGREEFDLDWREDLLSYPCGYHCGNQPSKTTGSPQKKERLFFKNHFAQAALHGIYNESISTGSSVLSVSREVCHGAHCIE